MEPKKADPTDIFIRIAQEAGEDESRLLIKFSPTEKAQLGKLAQFYKMPMAQVVKRLLHQAIRDYYIDGEVLALTDY